MSATNPGHRPVDVDLLADYLDGVLPDADASTVRDLVESDPAWASTMAALRETQPAVVAALSAYAADTGAMPADVSERITASLRSLPSTSGVGSLAAARRNRAAGSGSTRRGTAARLATNPWLRAAAVLVLVVIGVGVGVGLTTRQHLGSTRDSNISAGAAKDSSPRVKLPHVSSRPGLTVTASGTDYNSSLLAGPAGITSPVPAPALSAGGKNPLFAPGHGTVDPALNRLLDPTALNACLGSIEKATGGVASDVDFAAYQGQPAVVVTLASIATVVASGSDCGLPGAGADEIATTPVR